MTANPWPSSDWAAFLSERGVPATICLALALLGLLVAAARAATRATSDGRADRLLMLALALAATVLAIIAVGAFDAVLLLPAHRSSHGRSWARSLALSSRRPPRAATIRLPGALRRIAIVVVWSRARSRSSAARHRSSRWRSTSPPRERASTTTRSSWPHEWTRGVIVFSCGSRSRMPTALMLRARPHVAAARALFPNAPAPRHVLAECNAAGGTR